MSTPTTARTGAHKRKMVVIALEHSAWHAPSGAHREPRGRVRAVRPADAGARPGDRAGCRDVLRSSRLRFRGKGQWQATDGGCKADDPADSPAHKATRRPAEIRGCPVREATPGSGARAGPRLRRGALRTDQRPCRAVGAAPVGRTRGSRLSRD